jgi:hypothetical protein
MVMISTLFLIRNNSFMSIFWAIVSLIPSILIVGLVGLFLKVVFFGRLKYKLVIEEVNKKFTLPKLLIIIVIMLGITTGFTLSLLVGYWLTLVLEGFSLVILLITFNLMFPKKKEIRRV